METTHVEPQSHGYAEARRTLSNCWIYTPERGLRAVTMHGNGSSLAVDGRRLQRWCIMEEGLPPTIVAYVYAAEPPSEELRGQITDLARERFAHYVPSDSAMISAGPFAASA